MCVSRGIREQAVSRGKTMTALKLMRLMFQQIPLYTLALDLLL